MKYQRVELQNVRLSHPAVLHLLQGASLRQLLSNIACSGDGVLMAPCFLASAESPSLMKQPVVIPKLVLACGISAPEEMKEEEVQHALFLDQMS